MSRRFAARSAAATSRPRSAEAIRAERLPPSSIRWLSWIVVVRVALFCVSSTEVEISGLGRMPAWITTPSTARNSLVAADNSGLDVSARSIAAERVKVPTGSVTSVGTNVVEVSRSCDWALRLVLANTVNPNRVRSSNVTAKFLGYIRFSSDEIHVGESAGRHLTDRVAQHAA